MSLLYGPCLCGATDCPRCYPGSHDRVTCCLCGEEKFAYQIIGTECHSCRGSVCEDCEQLLVRTPIGLMCPDCATDFNGV